MSDTSRTSALEPWKINVAQDVLDDLKDRLLGGVINEHRYAA